MGPPHGRIVEDLTPRKKAKQQPHPPPKMRQIISTSVAEPNAALFATKEDLEDGKNYSSVLKRISELEANREKGKVSLKLTSEEEKGTFAKIFNRSQNKINLSIRNHEIAANVATGTTDKDDDRVIISTHENVIFAINPVKDTHANRTPIDEDPPLKVFISESLAAGTRYQPGTDPVEFLFKRYAELSSNFLAAPLTMPAKPDLPFAEHVDILVVLLRHCINTSTTAELIEARRHLRRYVMAASCHKMKRRVDLGKGKRRYYDVMTRGVTEIPLEAWMKPTPDDPVCSAVPNARQLEHFAEYERLIARPDSARGVEKLPVYDARGRERLHGMLSYKLRMTEQSLEVLTSTLPDNKLHKNATKHEHAAPLIDDAERKMHSLWNFVQVFEPVLKHHIAWLEDLELDPSSTQEGRATASTPDLSTVKGVGRQFSSAEYRGHPAAGATETVIEDGDVADSTKTDDDGEELDDIVKKINDLMPFSELFAEGGLKYLKLITLHASSIWRETDWDPEKPQPAARQQAHRFMTDSTFVVVEIERALRDTRRTKNFNECIDELVQLDPTLDKTVLQTILGGGDPNASLLTWKSFGGSMHCEFILVALMMLAETPELQSHLSMDWLNRNGIFAANTGLITRFKRMIPGIAISKRNCPICFKVCSIAASMGILKGATELVLPGYHSTHNEVEIPPFTPAEVANKVVTHMKTEAAQAMVRIMDQHRSLSADAASVGSHPNSGNSDGILPNEPLPHIDHPGVQVDTGVVQWPSSPPKEATLGPTPNLSMPPNYKPGQSPERTRKAGEELEGGAPETSRPRYDDSVEPDASGKAKDGKKIDAEMKTD